ncbi:MAG: hypothetical protein AB7E12_15980 [Burkholderiaceae bacterium]
MLKHRYTKLALIGLTALALAGCATHDRRQNNTMVGAGLGAAAGAVVSQGNPWYALGGAAAGGLLGNILTEDDRRSRRHVHGNKSRYVHGNKSRYVHGNKSRHSYSHGGRGSRHHHRR